MIAGLLGIGLLSPASAGVIEGLPSLAGPGQDQAFHHAQPAGDLDGDGLGDMALGAPYDDNESGHEAGAVWILYGEAWGQVGRWTPVGDVASHLRGESSQDHAGFDVAASGDVNGDGYDDLLVSAPDATEINPVVGKVYVVLGGGDGGDGELGDHSFFYGAERFSHTGWAVAPAGDIDGDGLAELLIGTPYPTANGDPGVGSLAMFYGRADGWPATNPVLMSYTSNTADQNTSADALFLVYDNGTFAGRASTMVADQDGDGLPELVLGAPGYTDDSTHIEPTSADPPPHGGIGPDEPGASHLHDIPVGAAYLFYSRPRQDSIAVPFQTEDDASGIIRGVSTGDYFPWLLTASSEGQLLASAPDALSTAGEAYLFEDLIGEMTTDAATVAWQGATPGDLLGWGMAAVDGIDDQGTLAALGEPGWSAGLGQVLLVSAVSGLAEAVASETLRGCWPESQVGTSIRAHAGPDPTGQDRPWAGITAPGASVYESGDGLAYILTADDMAAIGEDCDIPPPAEIIDGDGDGYADSEDCDDGAAWIYPGAPEVCSDGVDDNCDGQADESCGPPLDGGGCATGGGGAASWWLLLGAAALTRRRRALGRGALGCGALPLTLALLSIAGPASAQETRPLVRIWGSAAQEYLQGPVVSGDFDGDGLFDLAVANYRGFAYYYAPGEVFLLGHESVAGDIYLAETRTSIFGLTEHDYLGYDLAVLPSSVPGEADALLVGETFAGLTATDPGAALVFQAPLTDGGVLPADAANLGIAGDDNADRLGDTTILAGDLNGDGLPDAVVTAPVRDIQDRDWTGTAYIFHDDLTQLTGGYKAPTFATATIEGASAESWAGWRALGPGDLNGDGYDDLVLGTLGDEGDPGFSGRLHVFLGVDPGEALNTDQDDGAWTVQSPNAYMGYGLEGGDLSGNGRAQVAISSYTIDHGAGRVWLMNTAPDGVEDIEVTAEASWAGPEGSGAGFSLAMGPALLIGAPYADQVIVLDADLEEIGTIEGTGALGHWVGWVDDFDGDGVPEAALVAPEATDDLPQQGAAYLLSGASVLDGVFPATGIGLDDADGDGADLSEDCDDTDPRRTPGADEICGDAVDNNCDGVVDERACTGGGCSSAPPPRRPGFIWLVPGLAALLWRRR